MNGALTAPWVIMSKLLPSFKLPALISERHVKEEWLQKEISSLTCLAAELQVLLFFPVEEKKKASEEQICLSVLQALISDDNNDLFQLSKRGLKQDMSLFSVLSWF